MGPIIFDCANIGQVARFLLYFAIVYFENENNCSFTLQEDGEIERRFDPSGYDKDLVETLERDIVVRHPNVHW